jgi:hypothetical protein
LRSLTVQSLDAARPATKIAAARRFNLPKLLRPAFISICLSGKLEAADFALVPPEDMEKIMAARDELLRHHITGTSAWKQEYAEWAARSF